MVCTGAWYEASFVECQTSTWPCLGHIPLSAWLPALPDGPWRFPARSLPNGLLFLVQDRNSELSEPEEHKVARFLGYAGRTHAIRAVESFDSQEPAFEVVVQESGSED